MNKFNKTPKRREKRGKSVKTASVLALAVVFALVICGAVSAADNNVPLNTTHNGTVSGDLYVNTTQPVAWADQPTDVTSREFNQTFDLPTNTSANGSDIEWAEVYVNIYSGSGSNNWPLNATVLLDGDGDGVYETTLGTELLTSENYSTDGTIFWINDHCFRVYSDYQLWYDVTGLITCTNPSIYVKTEQVGTDSFDGRLKMITLVAAYNDGDNDKVNYWVNDGQDWISSGHNSSTTFNTGKVTNSITNATLNVVTLSSKDGTYTFNGTTNNGTDPVAPVNYFITHTWDITAAVTSGEDSTLNYTAGSSSFKSVLATLTIREALVAPVANFTASIIDGYAPLTVQFTDTSTGTTTGWAWDFDNDGTTDSTEQNPIYTYNNAGTYTVNLTVTGAGSTDTITKTNYITVTTNGLADTPWPKFGQNLNNTGQSAYNGPATNNIIWSYNTGSLISYSSPAITADGTIYIGNTYYGIFYALNPDGTVKWSYDTDAAIYSSPAIATDGTIYLMNDGQLLAFNPDGTLKWIYWISLQASEDKCSVSIGSDGTIYTTNQASIYAFNPDGSIKWSYTTGSTIFVSPAIGSDGTIYFGSNDKNLYALNPDGTLKWTYTTDRFIKSSTAIGSDGTIYFGCYNKNLYALNPDGTLKWTYTTGSYIIGSVSVCSDGTIYVGSNDNKLYALNPDGTLKWTYTVGDKIYGAPVISADGTIYVGSKNGNLYALNADGTLKWFYTTGGAIYGSAAIASDGTLYIASYDGNLYAFHDVVAPVASFDSALTDGRQGYVPLTVQFTDTSSNYPSSWLWDFGDGITSTEQSPTHTYTTAGNYTVTLTAKNSAGSDTVVKNDFFILAEKPVDTEAPVVSASPTSGTITSATNVTLSATDNWDINVPIYYTMDGTDPTTSSELYTDPITITATMTLKFIAVDTSGNISPVQSETYTLVDTEAPNVTATQDGTSVTLSATDNADPNPTIYYTMDGTDPTTDSTPYSGPITIPQYATTVVKFIAADASGNISSVQSKICTTYSGDKYMGGRFSDGDDLVNTSVYAEGNIGVRVLEYGGYHWFEGSGTATWTANELDIPEGATLISARIYQAITWYGYPDFTIQFNGNDTQQPIGYYWDNIAGQNVFDVTEYFNLYEDNTAIITGGQRPYGAILVVIYEAASEPYRQIWINEGADCLITNPPTIGYTTFNDTTTNNLISAKITTVMLSGESGDIENGYPGDADNIYFNDQLFYRTGYGVGADPGIYYFDVTSALENGTNELGAWGGSYLNFAIAILEVTKDITAPSVTASMGTGVFGDSQTVTLNAMDNMDTSPEIYYTLDGTTPTTNSTLYTDPISIDATTVLKFFAADDLGNASEVQTKTYIIDTITPATSADLTSGIYNSALNVVLSAEDNIDAHPAIYYTLNGDTPTTSSTLYSGPISINGNTTLQFIAADLFGNTSPVQTETYTIDTTAPTITTVDPANGTTSLNGDEVFTITFNEDIMEGTNWIELLNSTGEAMPFTTSIDGNVLTITPVSGLVEAAYKLMLHTGSITDLAGNLLAGQSFRFSVGSAPTITATSPINGITRVSANKTITVTFSEAIRRSSKFWVELVDSTGTAIDYTSYITGGNILVINPVSDLTESSYKLKIHTGSVTDLAGNLLAGQSFTFTVGSSPTVTNTTPVDGATNVNVAKTLTITFNENIRKSSNFWVEFVDSNDTAIDYTSYITGGNTLVINPVDDLAANTTYKIKLHTGCLTDTAGNPLRGTSLSFTTMEF